MIFYEPKDSNEPITSHKPRDSDEPITSEESKTQIKPKNSGPPEELIESMIFDPPKPLSWTFDQESTNKHPCYQSDSPGWLSSINFSKHKLKSFDFNILKDLVKPTICAQIEESNTSAVNDNAFITKQSTETSAVVLSNNYRTNTLTQDFHSYTRPKNVLLYECLNSCSQEYRQKLYDEFECNDAGDADLIYVILNNNLIYVIEEKLFYLWNGKIWEEICNEALKNFVTNILQERYMYKKYIATGKELEYFRKSCDNKKIDDVISLLKTKIYIREKQLNQTSYLLCVSNGVIDFKKQHIFNHDIYKSNYITKMIDIEYISGYRNCDFDNFINSIMEYDNGKIKFLQKSFGYSLTGDPNQQVCIFLKGDGSNGKSTLIEAIRNVLTEDFSCVIPKNILTCEDKNSANSASPALAQLKDKLIAFTSEMKNTDVLVESQFKKLVGGGTISARSLYKNTTEFKPKFTLFIDSNFLPKINDASESEAYAIFRRIMIVPFTVRFDKTTKDINLPNKLASEDSKMAILSWMIDGAFEYMDNGCLTPTLEMQRELDLYMIKENSILSFINNCIVHTDQYEDCISTSELYNCYVTYCEKNDMRPVTKNKFSQSQTCKKFELFEKIQFSWLQLYKTKRS